MLRCTEVTGSDRGYSIIVTSSDLLAHLLSRRIGYGNESE
jgi:hypothetical protein